MSDFVVVSEEQASDILSASDITPQYLVRDAENNTFTATFSSTPAPIMREQIALVFLLAYLVSSSLLVYLFISRHAAGELGIIYGFKLFALIFLALLGLWIFKNLSVVFTGRLFKNSLINSDFILTNFIFNSAVGLLLLPALIFAFYYSLDIGLAMGIIFWGILFLIKVLRQLMIGLGDAGFSLFNRIIYLCTVEILPFLVVIKLIMNELGGFF